MDLRTALIPGASPPPLNKPILIFFFFSFTNYYFCRLNIVYLATYRRVYKKLIPRVMRTSNGFEPAYPFGLKEFSNNYYHYIQLENL
jgi:hypothetical protein